MGSSSSDEGGKESTGFRLGGGVKAKNDTSLSTYLQLRNGAQEVTDGYLPESMKASTLLEQIACERNWPLRIIESDYQILERNRLFTVSDLRVLSKESWKAIELLPIVKDLLRNKIYGENKKSKKFKKKNKMESSCSSMEEPTEENLIQKANGSLAINGKETKLSPGSITPAGNKIKVVASNGKTYEADRYCPHKGVDLAKGWVNGNSVICPKHKWAFDLTQRGICSTKSGYTLKACEINDW